MQEISRDLSSLRGLLHQHWKGNILNETVLENAWNSEMTGYSFGKEEKNLLIFKNIDLGRHISPSFDESLSDIKVKLGVNIKYHTNGKNSNCIEKLGVNLSVGGFVIDKKGNGMDVIFSLHLDKDEKQFNDKKEELKPDFTHALYHLNFGGDAMRKHKNEDGKPYNYGSLLLMETPRVVHHPMDAILAVDFILRNFYKEENHIKITRQPKYKQLLKKAACRYLKPYYQGIMSKWDDIETDLTPEYLLPSLDF